MVIAIIAVLAAMLFPIGLRAREASRRAICPSNLREIGLAFSMYVTDWDDCFPNTGDPYLWMGRRWRWCLAQYLGEVIRRDPRNPEEVLRSSSTPQILLCPSDNTSPTKYDGTSYGYCAAFYHTPGQLAVMTTDDLWKVDRFACVTQRLEWVAYPAQKVLVAEWLSSHEREAAGWWDWRGARNYLFVDGHARYLRARQLRRAGDGYPDPNLTAGGLGGRDVE